MTPNITLNITGTVETLEALLRWLASQDMQHAIAAQPVAAPVSVPNTYITAPTIPLAPNPVMPTFAPVPTTAAPVITPVPTTAAPVITPAPATIPTAAPVVPTTAPTYTLADFQRACAPLIDAGRQQDLSAMLQNFGVPSLVHLPKERYPEFANALRALGAKL